MKLVAWTSYHLSAESPIFLFPVHGSIPAVVILAISVTVPVSFTLNSIFDPTSFEIVASLPFKIDTLRSLLSPTVKPASTKDAIPLN